MHHASRYMIFKCDKHQMKMWENRKRISVWLLFTMLLGTIWAQHFLLRDSASYCSPGSSIPCKSWALNSVECTMSRNWVKMGPIFVVTSVNLALINLFSLPLSFTTWYGILSSYSPLSPWPSQGFSLSSCLKPKAIYKYMKHDKATTTLCGWLQG